MPVNPAFDASSDNQFTSAKLARMGMGQGDVMLAPDRSEPHIIRKLFVEFLGDTIFVFIGSLSALSAKESGVAAPAFAHGLTIAVLIMCFGHISGGHFNPCVTLGIALTGNIRPLTAVLYAGVQLLGGCFGALLVRAVLSYDAYSTAAKGGETLLPHLFSDYNDVAGTEWWQGIMCEMILTFILVNSVLMTAVDTDSNVLAPLAIGLSLTLDIFGAGHVSGASMNPARSFGPAIMASIFADHDTGVLPLSQIWAYHYVYWIGPALGASLAAVTYKALLAKDEKRWLL
uniref:Aquaporin-8 n=1 Tax=Plectus sambesii TaxID=2011161 RepID=A0A914WWZ7_9BILA